MSEYINRKGSYYDTENDMINDPSIRAGLIVHTLGKNTVNDSLGAMYNIIKYTNAVVVNELKGVDFYQIRTSEHLFAEKIQMDYQIMDDDAMSDKELTVAFKQLKNEVEGSITQLANSTKQTLITLTQDIENLSGTVRATNNTNNERFNNIDASIRRLTETTTQLDGKIDQTASSIRNEITETSESLSRLIRDAESISKDSNDVMIEYMINNEIVNLIDVIGDGSLKIKGDINGTKYIVTSGFIYERDYANDITLTDSNMWIVPVQMKLSDGRIDVVENDNFKMELLTVNDDQVLRLTLKQPAVDNVVTEYR